VRKVTQPPNATEYCLLVQFYSSGQRLIRLTREVDRIFFMREHDYGHYPLASFTALQTFHHSFRNTCPIF
jgi:hypothetical protein